jgi:hypothetical protein
MTIIITTIVTIVITIAIKAVTVAPRDGAMHRQLTCRCLIRASSSLVSR